MKIAIVGSSGYIASFLFNKFSELKEIESIMKIDKDGDVDASLDLLYPEKFDYSQIDDTDFIIFTAAISGPDKCAKDFDNCWMINVTGTSYFINESLKRNCRVLFFSSDAVFGDDTGYVFNEESVTAANTPYGQMKKAIEDRFKGNALFKAIRLSYVASSKDRFISYCLECIRTNEIAEIFHPFYRNVVTVSDVINVVIYLTFHWDEYLPTFLNVAGKELVSRVRIADEINRIFNDRLKYTILKPKKEFFINRSRITQMRSLYMDTYCIISENTFTEKIANELEEIQL